MEVNVQVYTWRHVTNKPGHASSHNFHRSSLPSPNTSLAGTSISGTSPTPSWFPLLGCLFGIAATKCAPSSDYVLGFAALTLTNRRIKNVLSTTGSIAAVQRIRDLQEVFLASRWLYILYTWLGLDVDRPCPQVTLTVVSLPSVPPNNSISPNSHLPSPNSHLPSPILSSIGPDELP